MNIGLCIFTFLVLSFANVGHSQTLDETKKTGHVTYKYDNRLDSLIAKHIRISEQKKSIPGYRVQIYFGGQRNKANEIKTEFLKKYPEENAYLIYQQPNFKIRVGDFRDRLQAQEFYLKLLPDFNTAFIVKDDISLPELK